MVFAPSTRTLSAGLLRLDGDKVRLCSVWYAYDTCVCVRAQALEQELRSATHVWLAPRPFGAIYKRTGVLDALRSLRPAAFEEQLASLLDQVLTVRRVCAGGGRRRLGAQMCPALTSLSVSGWRLHASGACLRTIIDWVQKVSRTHTKAFTIR